jgi:hypothetical protein
MSDSIAPLISRNFFSARREAVSVGASSLRYFQGRNHVLTTINGPENYNTPDMQLSIRVQVFPRSDNPFLVT